MSSPVDHVANLIGLMPGQYKKQPGIVAWLTALGNRLNELDSAIQDLINLTTLANATGVQLDGWGDILNQTRDGLNDSDYRNVLEVLVAAHSCLGTIPELESLFARLMGVVSVLAYDYYPADFWLDASLPTPLVSLAFTRQVIMAAKPGGVKIWLMEETALPYFGFAEDSSPNAAGFTTDGTDGGTFATLF